MTEVSKQASAWQRRRWMRPNAHLYVRPDAHRFMPLGKLRRFGRDVKYFSLETTKRAPESGEQKLDASIQVDQRQDYETQCAFIRERWLIAGLRFQLGLLRLSRQQKALYPSHYDPTQPRVPKGNPEGGEWTRFAGDVPGIGHNQGPPLGDPPQIPKKKPSTGKATNNFLKAAARWVTAARAIGARVAPFVAAYEAMSWLDTDRPFIDAYQDQPKTLQELQEAAQGPSQRGYQTHHVVEQTPAEDFGIPRSMIDAPDNLVRIPAIKHWEITGWYMKSNPAYNGLSPRDYLSDKPWDERTKVGIEALRRFGVLKP